MKCPNCQNEVAAECLFCSKCGAGMPRTDVDPEPGRAGHQIPKRPGDLPAAPQAGDSAAQPPPGPGVFQSGRLLLGRYRMLGELGRGGMGVVCRCLDEVSGIEVAVKALPPEVSHSPAEMAEVRENFRMVERLHHPNIAAVKTLEREPATGAYFLVMELAEGADLSSWRKQQGGKVSLESCLAILRPIAQALEYAHSRKIIHRDVKPANVIIGPDGAAKVLDLGLAAQIQASLSRVSQAHYSAAGTPPYMAPEQWRGQRQTGATDQYALAVMAYELLAGRLPFETSDAVALRESVLRELPERPEGIAGGVWAALLRGLAKERDMRHWSCVGFVEALAGKGSFRETSSKLALAVGLFAVLAGLGWGFWHLSGSFAARKGNQGTSSAGPASAPAPPSVVEPRKPAASAPPKSMPDGKRPWTNSLGMRFVPVPGTKVLFSIWDTRMKDYAAYAQANTGVDASWRYVEYEGQPVSAGPEHPVTMVAWAEAKAFCRWLTEEDQRAGFISGDQRYRLPTDAEWSLAVGLQEPGQGTPKEKDGKVKGVYPWGTEWPPPGGAGNYADGAAKRRFSSWTVIERYEDGYATTSPVGSFGANRFGLFDMGGNVWQWCEDWYDSIQASPVLRGGSWRSDGPNSPLSSYRDYGTPGRRDGCIGFRVVLAGGSSR